MVCKKKGNKHFQKSTVGSLFADSFKLKYIFVFNGLGSFKIWKLFLNYLTCMLLYSIIYYYYYYLLVKYFYNLIVLNNTCNVSIQRAHAVSFLWKLLRSFKMFLWRSAGSPADLANIFNLSRITKVERNCPHCPRNCPHFPVIDICPPWPYSPKYLSITL